MKNLLKFIFILFPLLVNAQEKMLNSTISNGSLDFEFSLDPVPYSVNTDQNKDYIKFDAAAEYNKKSFILPKRDLIIALPSYSEVELTSKIISSEMIKGIPEISPDVELDSKSNLIYKKPNNISVGLKQKKDVEILGYLWIGNYYCVQLRVNQYKYNFIDGINEINKINIKLKIKNPDKTIPASETLKTNNVENSLISNIETARQLNRQFYDNSLSKSQNYNWIDFTANYVKIGTSEDDIYRISRNDLQNLGVSVTSIDPRTFKLFLRGEEIPVFVQGENDGSFDSGDFVEFVGLKNMGSPDYRTVSIGDEEYKEYLNRYSDTTVYWLTWNGQNGKRVKVNSGSLPATGDTVTSYIEVAHYEQDRYLDYTISDIVKRQEPFWHANESWMWGTQSVGSASRDFVVSDHIPGRTAQAYYKVQDFASAIGSVPLYIDAHKVGLSINNDTQVFDSLYFDKYAQRVVSANFSSDLLTDGTNKLKTISFPTEATINSIFFDWYEVDYPRYLNAKNDSLKFSVSGITDNGIYSVKVSKFGSSDIRVYKYSGNYELYTNRNISGGKVSVSDTIKNSDKFIFKSASKIHSPKLYYARKFQNLTGDPAGKDYLIITHKTFLNKSEEYSSFIEQNFNVSTEVVDVERIYDQFNYGFFSPEPIKDFLTDAYSKWNIKPAYLNLIGDANYDYYENKTKYFSAPKSEDFVPSYGDPVSDSWFVIWDTTGALIPQMNIGRIPVKNIQQFDHYFTKLRNYVQTDYDEWNKTYMIISSGDSKSQSELTQLKTANELVINNSIKPKPIGGYVSHLYKTASPQTNFGPYSDSEIDSMFNLGGLLVSYLGHSGTQIWDNGIEDVTQLYNESGKSPLISDFGCSTGKFAEPDIDAFSELFVAGTDGNAIAYLGNASLGFVSTATSVPNIFYGILLKNNVSMAEAHVLAKTQVLKSYGSGGSYRIFTYTNTFFGDPIVQLRKPLKPNLIIRESDIELSEPIDDTSDSTGVTVNFRNLGLVDTSVFKIKINDYYEESVSFSKEFSLNLPLNSSSIGFNLPARNFKGSHRLEVLLDPENTVDEIYENDNSISRNYDIISSSVDFLVEDKKNFRTNGNLNVLSPITKPDNDSITIEIADNPQFAGPEKLSYKTDSVKTDLNLVKYPADSRYWLRIKKSSSEGDFYDELSFIKDSSANYYYSISDSMALAGLKLDSVLYTNQGFRLAEGRKTLLISSSGFTTGGAAVLNFDGVEYAQNPIGCGHHMIVIDKATLEVEDYQVFNYWGNNSSNLDPSNYDSCLSFLKSIPNTKYLAVAIGGDCGGYNVPADLITEYQKFGSAEIQNVKYGRSWIMFGSRGSAVGSVPEYLSSTEKVSYTDSLIFTINSGMVETRKIEKAGALKKLLIDSETTDKNSVDIFPVIYNGKMDTLNKLTFSNNVSDISSIQLNNNESISFLCRFSTNGDSVSPILKSLKVEYALKPELLTNYAVTKLSYDTVDQGSDNILEFSVHNAGETAADTFRVKVFLINAASSSRLLLDTVITGLLPDQYVKLLAGGLLYEDGYGKMNYKIIIDPDDEVSEIFEDNNVYNSAFYVKKDTTVGVSDTSVFITFDGQDVLEGEYIQSNPEIQIKISDLAGWFDYAGNSNIQISLDGTVLPSDSLIAAGTGTGEVTYSLHPEFSNGIHSLRFWVDRDSKFENAADIERIFQVETEMKLLDVYNYPNPFSNVTYFTFKLTQVPDELKLKIYTVAGRLIKEFNKSAAELGYDFNEIYWDGRDQDGDLVANGVYIYKLTMKKGDETQDATQKLAIVR